MGKRLTEEQKKKVLAMLFGKEGIKYSQCHIQRETGISRIAIAAILKKFKEQYPTESQLLIELTSTFYQYGHHVLCHVDENVDQVIKEY